jgi:hypothetical protein
MLFSCCTSCNDLCCCWCWCSSWVPPLKKVMVDVWLTAWLIIWWLLFYWKVTTANTDNHQGKDVMKGNAWMRTLLLLFRSTKDTQQQ